MMYELRFFAKSQDGVCADDFKKEDRLVVINLTFLLSLSGLEEYHLPISGGKVGKCAIVTMSNSDKYYIREKSFYGLCVALNPNALQQWGTRET